MKNKLAMSRSRIVSKSDVLLLHRPKSRRHPRINVRVSVETGTLSVQSMEKGCIFFKVKIVEGMLFNVVTNWFNQNNVLRSSHF